MKMKRIFAIFLIALLFLMPIFADGDDSWWFGKSISEFRYTGLQNVSERTINSLLSKYKGRVFTEEMASEIDALLYGQEWMDYYMMSAETGDDEYSLALVLDIKELPRIKNIEFSGNDKVRKAVLLSEQNIEVGSWYSPGLLRANAEALKTYYIGRGYKDAEVSFETSIDEERNIVTLVYKIVEGPQYKVSSFVFDGVSAFTEKEIKKVMESKQRSFFRAGSYVESKIAADISSIILLYNQNGYIDAKSLGFDYEDVTTEEDKYTMLRVTIKVDEGEQWKIGKLTFRGNNVISSDDINAKMRIKEGQVLNMTDLQSQISEISSLFYNQGYIQTQIRPIATRNETEHTVDYDLAITESRQSVIEKIVITGLKKTKPHVFERELELHVGDVFSQEKLQKSGQNILNTTIVTDIKTGIYPGETEDGVVLELAIEEGNQMELQFGATFGGTVDGFPVSGFLQWSDKNLMGTGRNLSISTNLSPDTQSLSVSLSDGWVGNKRWSNGISLNLERSNKSNALQRGIGSTYFNGRDRDEVTWPLGYDSALDWYNSEKTYPATIYLMEYDFYRVSVGYNTGYTFVFQPGSLKLSGGLSLGINHAVYSSNFDPYDNLIRKYHDGWRWSNKLMLSITWDGRDLVQNTTKGYLFGVSYTYAGGILQGLSNYNKLTFNAAGYAPLYTFLDDDEKEKSIVLSLSSQVSFMLPQWWNNTDEGGWDTYDAKLGATQYEMLYLDGMNIGRGFSSVLDKSFLWHSQIEVDYPLVRNMLNAEVYASATGLMSDLDDLEKFSNMHWYFSIGAGLKLRIPGFPLGLYLCKTAEWEESDGFYWNSGPMFKNMFGSRDDSGLKLVLAITTSLY